MTNKENLKALIKGIYDFQKLRIQIGNRITQNIKVKLGQKPGMKESEIEKEAEQHLKVIRKHFKLITDGLLIIPTAKKFVADGIFDDYTAINLAGMYSRAYVDEQLQLKRLEGVIEAFPIWTEFLDGVKGCGPLMAGVIIATLDPYKAKYPSSFHAYCGLDVINGHGRSRKKEDLVEQEYVDANGKTKTKMGISFNPFAKTKLVGVLGPSFVKQSAEKCKYRRVYVDYKNRLKNHKNHKDKSDGHINNMAIRYCVKIFLIDLHLKWREIEGLEVHPPYAEAKLGYKHGRDE